MVLEDIDAIKVELALRVGLVVLVGTSLSVAPAESVDTVLPVGLQYLVGILACSLAASLPKFQSTVLAMFPAILASVILICVGSTLVLSAATVSDGWMCAVFAVYAYLLTGFFFGAYFEQTNALANLFVSTTGILALSFRPVVQNGLELIRVSELDVETCQSLGILDEGTLANMTTTADESLTDRVKEILPYTFSVDALFEGQMATVDADPTTGEIVVSVPGGMWLVKAFWSESGLDNGLAFYRNLWIVLCWVLFIFACGIYCPPSRTQRQSIAKHMVPTALKTAAALTQLQTGNDDDEEKTRKAFGTLVHLLHAFNHGKLATITMFEPRWLHLLTEDLVTPLRNVLLATHQTVIGSSLLWCLSLKGYIEVGEDEDAQRSLCGISLNKCAAAIESNDSTVLTAASTANSESCSPKIEIDETSYILPYLTSELEKATIAWIQALTVPCLNVDCGHDGLKTAARTVFMWFAGPILVLYSQFAVIFKCNTIKPNLQSILWSVKLAAGFVALFTMSVFWDRYSDFAIAKPTGTIGSVFSGWQLLSYSCVWTPTVEGTIEKGIFRTIGTVAGGFSAWIAVIVCSGSFDDQPDINPFALAAWLTITSTLVVFLNSDEGINSFSGLSYDHGMAANYFIMTQALIALEVNSGSGDRDDLVTNRIAATVAGASMAMLLAAVPPVARGNDPRMLTEIHDHLLEAFSAILEACKPGSSAEVTEIFDKLLDDKWRASVLERPNKAIRLANFKLKDAGHLKRIPFLRVDESFQPLVEEFAITAGLLDLMMQIAVQCVKDMGNSRSRFLSVDVQDHLREITSIMDKGPREREPLPINDKQDHKVFAFLSLAQGLALVLLKSKDKCPDQ